MKKTNKLGYLAPKGLRQKYFQNIEIGSYVNGKSLQYCWSHNFVYDEREEKKKLYDGKACYYTDDRFYSPFGFNFYGNCYLFNQRHGKKSLKSCIRKILKCKNIPLGTIVKFGTSWYYPDKEVNTGYNFKVKKENKMDIEYEISMPEYFNNFNSCEFSKELTNRLRKEGFIVAVYNNNPSFILGMVQTAILATGKEDDIENEGEGEYAIAYGFGKKIGFSSGKNDFQGYYDGEKNILYDFYGEFDKWSRCRWIPKTTPIDEIIEQLKEPNVENDNCNEEDEDDL